jgi:hypothetical protein
VRTVREFVVGQEELRVCNNNDQRVAWKYICVKQCNALVCVWMIVTEPFCAIISTILLFLLLISIWKMAMTLIMQLLIAIFLYIWCEYYLSFVNPLVPHLSNETGEVSYG